MGNVFKKKHSEDQVQAWGVDEVMKMVKETNGTPVALTPFLSSHRLKISRDHKDNVLVKAYGLNGNMLELANTDVLVVMPGTGPSRGDLVALTAWEFESRYEELVLPEPESEGYSLVVPFVTVTSKNGPHEDQAYTAGWEMGLLYEKLRATPHEMQIITIRTENLPQADLILMKYGYTSEKIQQEPDVPEWTRLVLIPKEESDEA